MEEMHGLLYSILAYSNSEYSIVSMKVSIYSKDHQTLVGKIKKARADAGLDQKRAAQLMGTSQSNISKIESGQRRVNVLQLKELARVYKKRLSYFID